MNDTEREYIENQILLRSTGELPHEENSALDAVLARDAEAADFAHFVAERLPASAPRDFAATAIRDAVPERKVIAFPLRWKLAAAAAVAIGAFVATRSFTPDTTTPPIADTRPPVRVMADISTRMDALESELTTARQRLAHGRYHRNHDTL